MEDYSNETLERAYQLYSENKVLGVLKKGNLLIGTVKDVERDYRVVYDLEKKEGECECRIGKNCEHIVAVKMSFEKGEYVDIDKIEGKIIKMNKRELSWLILSLLEKFPQISNYIAPVENPKEIVKRYVKILMQNQEKSIINSFKDFLINNKEIIEKEDIFEILDAISSCNAKCFYNFSTDENIAKELLNSIADILTEKGIENKDVEILEKIMEKDKFGNLDDFFVKLFNQEKFRNSVNPLLYLNVLVRNKEKDRVMSFLRQVNLSNEEKFDILYKIDENEALEFAKVNMLYSKLFEYYYNLGEFNNAVKYLEKMIEMKDIPGLSRNLDKITKIIRGDSELIKKLYYIADNTASLYRLLIPLYDNSSGSMRFDIANSILNKINSFPEEDYPQIVRIIGEQRKEKLPEVVILLVEKLAEKRKYEEVIEIIKEARKYLNNEDFNNLLSTIKDKYKKKRQLYELINKYLS